MKEADSLYLVWRGVGNACEATSRCQLPAIRFLPLILESLWCWLTATMSQTGQFALQLSHFRQLCRFCSLAFFIKKLVALISNTLQEQIDQVEPDSNMFHV